MHLPAWRVGLAGPGAALLLAGCSVLPDAAPADGSPSSAGPTPTPAVPAGVDSAPEPDSGVELRGRVTRVAGHLSDARRERVTRRAGAVVEDYLDAMTAPGDDLPEGFVRELRPAARADDRVLGPGNDVEVERARAWFSVAAPGGRPVGLTVRLAVDLAPKGGGTPAGTLTGRLFLTRVAGDWRVFGYDLARSGTGAPVQDGVGR